MSACVCAAEKDDSQEKITSSGREQIESFIGAVSEKITPPVPEPRTGSGAPFPPRLVSPLCKAVIASAMMKCIMLFGKSAILPRLSLKQVLLSTAMQ